MHNNNNNERNTNCGSLLFKEKTINPFVEEEINKKMMLERFQGEIVIRIIRIRIIIIIIMHNNNNNNNH